MFSYPYLETFIRKNFKNQSGQYKKWGSWPSCKQDLHGWPPLSSVWSENSIVQLFEISWYLLPLILLCPQHISHLDSHSMSNFLKGAKKVPQLGTFYIRNKVENDQTYILIAVSQIEKNCKIFQIVMFSQNRHSDFFFYLPLKLFAVNFHNSHSSGNKMSRLLTLYVHYVPKVHFHYKDYIFFL